MTGATHKADLLPDSWQVQLPVFEGPLDLLLHLVRINEVEVRDIPVARVCDQFHAYLGLMEELNLDIAAEYIYEAALLIYLKSRLLLPRHQSDSETLEEDPRQDLVERLLEYRKIKEASQSLAEMHGLRLGIWTRDSRALSAEVGSPAQDEIELEDVSLFELLSALRDVMVRYDHDNPPALHLRGESFSVREQFLRLLDALREGSPFDLLADLGGRSCRAEAVAAFLSVLELARLDLIRLHQTETGELLLYRTERQVEDHELETIQG